ncbi:hypothetical protein PC120_g8325 [Phytophthora cactorum]|nr:hypothetical protein PC120_g8325 [Phytophthora cactorum]
MTSQQLLVKYVAADAEAAQQNAVNQVFGVDSGYAHLMCFYHVMAKVHEKLSSKTYRTVLYDEQVKIVLEKWSLEEQLTGFRSDFNNIWIESDFSRWQCFHTPGGYATTNNPVEQFNRLIKRDYTLHTKHKIGTLPQLLADCCGDQSVTPRTFKEPLAAVEGQS